MRAAWLGWGLTPPGVRKSPGLQCLPRRARTSTAQSPHAAAFTKVLPRLSSAPVSRRSHPKALPSRPALLTATGRPAERQAAAASLLSRALCHQRLSTSQIKRVVMAESETSLCNIILERRGRGAEERQVHSRASSSFAVSFFPLLSPSLHLCNLKVTTVTRPIAY